MYPPAFPKLCALSYRAVLWFWCDFHCCCCTRTRKAVLAHNAATDLNKPLMELWREILERPNELVENYEKLWNQQYPNKKEFFFRIRDGFNATHQPHYLLYLLARIVKGSVRYSAEGKFNQSADNRHWGMLPKTMRQQIFGVSTLLAGRTTLSAVDFCMVAVKADRDDLILWIRLIKAYPLRETIDTTMGSPMMNL